MQSQLAKVNESVAFLERETELRPPIAVVLGTGLGGLANKIKAAAVISYKIYLISPFQRWQATRVV